MKKKDLRIGNVVELRNGEKFIACTKIDGIKFDLIDVKGELFGKLSGWNENLEDFGNHNFDIVKVYEDYTCQKVLWKRKEIIISEDEKVILRNILKDLKYIVRDSSGKLHIFTHKPKKVYTEWVRGVSEGKIVGDYINFSVYNHLFQFITWEDKEPYLISDLLEENKEYEIK